MALSGIFYGPWLGDGYHRIFMEWSATQNVTDNTSTITCVLKWQSTGFALSSSTSKSVHVWIAGQQFSGSATAAIGAGATKTLLTAVKTVTHASDGTLSTIIKGTFDLAFTLGGTTYASTTTGDDSITLNTIPRATQPTLSASTTIMGNAVTINTPRASGSFTHTLKYSYNGASGTIATGVGISHAWTIPLTLANQIPNSTSGSGTITCETYSGSTLIGTKTVSFTATVPTNVVPTVSIGKSGVSLYLSQYVKWTSKVAVTLTAAGSYSSTIASRTTTVKSGSYLISSSVANSFTSGLLNYSGTITIVTTVTDSRGRTATTSTTISVVAYSAPAITAFAAFRANSDGTANPQGAYIRITGTSSIASIATTNTKSTSLQYKLKSSGTWTTATTNTASYTPSLAATVAADINSSYDVRIVVTDYYSSNTSESDVGTAFVLMDFHTGGKGMAIGKVAETAGIMDVGLPMEVGDITASGKYWGKFRAVAITTGQDLNDFNEAGFYTCPASATAQSLLNCPSASAFSLFVETHAGTKQTLTVYASADITTYVRNRYTTTWGTWRKVWNGVGDAVNADTVDGIHASGFATSGHNHSGVYVATKTVTFINATLINGWVQYSGWGAIASYYKDALGMVYLRGLIKSGPIPSICMTLPAGYRPAFTTSLPILKDGNLLGQVNIYTNGNVEVANGSTVATFLECIPFYGAN